MADVWQAFQDLNCSRTAGFDFNPIQVNEIQAWLSIHEVTELEDKVEYYRLITTLDRVWLKWSREKHEAKNANTKTGN